MPKRKDRVAPPPAKDGWDCRFWTSDAATGWDQICATAPANARLAWEQITKNPHQRDHRQHPLKGDLGSRTVNGKDLEQWQYEVTSGGRIWYCVDADERMVWMTEANPGHPKKTE